MIGKIIAILMTPVKKLISRRFHMTYHLLCRWKTELEFFLYQFCKTAAPDLINECH